MSAVLTLPLESPALEQPLPPAGPEEALFKPPADFVSIRGVRLPRAELVDRSLFSAAQIERLRDQLMAAAPFPHLVLENLFHPALLVNRECSFPAILPHWWPTRMF